MVFSEIRARIGDLIRLAGWSNTETAPDLAYLANHGSREFFTETQILTADTTATSVVGQAEYTLTTPPEWVRITDVLWGTSTPLTQVTEARLRQRMPLWSQEGNGVPLYWWVSKANEIKLHPKPDVASTTIYVHGIRLDAVLDGDSDSPSCPAIFHEGICLLGAYHHGKLYAVGEQRQTLAAYMTEAENIMGRCRDFFAGQDSHALTRRVNRTPATYVNMGSAW